MQLTQRSDILAEIDLPRVGLEKRDYFPYPDGYVPSEGAGPSNQVQLTSYDEIMRSYSFQLHIRGILNQAQQSLYAPGRLLPHTCCIEMLMR